MFLHGQTCPICGQPITEGQVFTTWGAWLPPDDPLFPLCDGGIHWDCYAAWPDRDRFASSYFAFWVASEEQDIYWHRAFLDENVLVTVNPGEPIRSTWVHLRRTGDRISVKLDAWEAWLVRDESIDAALVHPVLLAALREAKAALRSAVPTAAEVEAACDQPRKRAVVEAYVQAERQRRQRNREIQREITPHNAACNRLMKRIEEEGLACPHCHVHSTRYRISRRKAKKSAVICTSCGWVVNPLQPSEASEPPSA